MTEKIQTYQRNKIGSGATAILLAEDHLGLADSIANCVKLGFRNLMVCSAKQPEPTDIKEINCKIYWLERDVSVRSAQIATLNQLIQELPDRWVYYGFNAEFFQFPFMESRSIEDLAQFMEEERRKHVFAYVVDLYSAQSENEFYAPDDAFFDTSGYYAMDRYEDGLRLERQIDVYGGLKWRYSEHVPFDRQRINRVPFFKTRKGLCFDENFRLNDPEMNTYACPWHHNLTGAVASFRAAKSLRRNPGSANEIDSFHWSQSRPFEWSSKQLMELGLMEPGQWF